MRVNYNFDMNKLARHFTYEITLESNNKKSRAVGYGYIGQNSAHFFNSRLIDKCNKTELKIMRYIDVTLKDHSCSLKLSNKDIAVSLGLNSLHNFFVKIFLDIFVIILEHSLENK